jgi:acetyl-CoA/propionyl-CoA carboxylase biotin carboxyl carrier protein
MRVAGHDPVETRSVGRARAAEVVLGDTGPRSVSATWGASAAGTVPLVVTFDGVTRRYACARDGDTLWLARDGHAWAVREEDRLATAHHTADAAGGPVRSPMPGTVTVVDVVDGQAVRAGQRLVVVEAMKMEHAVSSPVDGTVRHLRAAAGSTVARDAVLLVVESAEAPGASAERAGAP